MDRKFLASLISMVAVFVSSCLFPLNGLCAEKENGAAVTRELRKYSDKWALVIGIDTYADPALNTVLPLDSSAHRVSDALAKKGFASDHIRLIQNGGASRQSILSSVTSWLGKLSRSSDLAVVFIATQCFPASDGEVYLFPYDTRLSNFFNSAINAEDIIKTIKSSVQAQDVVIVFQTSFSGAPEMMAGCKTMFARYNVAIQPASLPDNFTVMVSSKASQPTWGTYFSDNLAEDLTLSSADMSLQDLFNKIRSDTIYDTAKDCAGCKVQTPILLSRDDAKAISLSTEAQKPVTELPGEIALFLKGQAAYQAAQAVCDQFRIARMKQEGWSASAVPFRQLEHTKSTKPIPEELKTKIDENIKAMEQHLKTDPNFAAGHFMLARLFQLKADYPAAIAQYKEAVRLSPDNSSYHGWLARTLQAAGQSAVLEWQAAFKCNNKNLSALDNLAIDAEEKGDLSKAYDLLNHALAIYPGDAGLQVRISSVLKQQGKLKQAVEHAQEAVFLDERSVDALVNLGDVLIANKDERGAHAAYIEALELGSKEPEYYFVLAQGLEKTNDAEGAIQAWTKFLESSPKEDKRIDDAKKRIDELKKASQ